MSVVQGDEKGPDCYLAQPVEDGVQAVRKSPLGTPRAQHLTAQQGFQSLPGQPEG